MKPNNFIKKLNFFIKKIINNLVKYKKLTVFIVFLIIFVYISYKYYYYLYILKDPVKIKELILSYGRYSIIIFILFQIIQVIVFFIPGEIVQIAGGYIYGTFLGGVLSSIGIFLGSFMVYYISRYLGRDLVQKMISKDKFKFFNKILKSSNNVKVIFFLYLVPGIPKDALAYICGISNISFKEFIIFSTLGRIPAIFISTYFGNRIEVREFSTIIVIAFAMILLFIIGSLKGKSIIKRIFKEKN